MASQPDSDLAHIGVRGASNCKMEVAQAAASTIVHETLFKQEALDGEWPETCANMCDALFVAVKHEICDVSFEFEHSRVQDDTAPDTVADVRVAHVIQETRANISNMNANRSQPPTDNNTELTSTTNESLLIKYSLNKRKWYTCKFCNFKCVKSNVFINHMITHLGKTYCCNQCDFKCGLKRLLDKHMITHTGEKPFSCELCVAKFSHAGHLTNHMRMHESYHCEHCDYTCILAVHLKNHMMTHTENKPFTCAHCEYKCSKGSDLESHMETHNGKKKFACEYCNYRCANSRHLKDHVMTHTGEKPFKCQQCEYKCSRASNLKRHNTKIHPVVKNLPNSNLIP